MKAILLIIGLSLTLLGCHNNSPSSAIPPSPKQPSSPTVSPLDLSPLDSIKKHLLGDWEEDTIAFKKEYHMPPPPAQNLKVRYQEDGYVYIPGVLLTPDNWDKWQLVNDSTIHITKRETGAIVTFIIDNITADVLNYRMIVSPLRHRKFRLIKIKK